MLYIYTNKNTIPHEKQCIDDVEAQYTLKRTDIIKKYESSPLALNALKEIEKMSYIEMYRN